MRKSSLTSKAITMFFIMFFSKILGFGRDILTAYKFGTTYVNDAYTVAITVPSILFAVFISGFIQSYIPFYTRIDSKAKRTYFFGNIFVTLTLFSTGIAVVCAFASPILTQLLAPGFDEKTASLTSQFIAIIAFMFPFYAGFSVLSAQLQTEEKFAMAYFCDFIVVNLIIIFSIALASEKNSMILPIGYCISMITAFFILIIYFRYISKGGFRINLSQAKSDFSNLIRIAIPVGLCFMVNQVNSITDQIFSSLLGNGVITSLNYANKIQTLFLTMTTTVFMTICFPRINKDFADKRKKEGMYYVEKGFLVGSLLAIPFAVFIITFAKPIVIIVFQHGAFNENSTTVTSACLLFYSLGIPFYTYTEIESRTMTADMEQKMILKNTFIAVVFNIILDYMLMNLLGYIGLSLATSLSGILLFILLGRQLKKEELWVIHNGMLRDIVKIICSAVISAVISVKIFSLLNTVLSIYFGFAVASFTFGVLFFAQCCLYKTAVLKWLLNRILKVNNLEEKE